MKFKGILYAVISAFIFGFTPALTKITYSFGNNSLSMTFYRNLFVIPVLLIILKYRKIDLKVSKGELKNIFIVSIFGLTLTNVLLYSSYSYIGIGSATTLHFLYPMFVALVCRFIYKEKLGKRKVYSLILAFIGVLFFIDVNIGGSVIGAAMALISSATYSFYIIWLEKKDLVKIDPYKLSLYIAIFASGTLLIGNTFGGYIRFNLPIKIYLLMIGIAILTSIVGVVLFQISISMIGSSSAAIFSLLEPVTSIIAGALLFSETITIYKFIGCLIIFISIISLAITKKDNPEELDSSLEIIIPQEE